MKRCFKCGKDKPIEDFYRHKRMADGHLNKCKECTKRDSRETRAAKLEYYRQYDRDRANRPNRLQLSVFQTKQYRAEHPNRYVANSKVGNALRDGRLVRPDHCSKCGNKGKVFGHHPDYSKPLDVIWLCQPCHKQVHKET